MLPSGCTTSCRWSSWHLRPATPVSVGSPSAGRIDETALSCNQIDQAADSDAWRQLGAALSTLGTALDTTIRLRADGADEDVTAEAVTVVNRSRADLQRALYTVRQTS